jgi:hypothetical protein
MSRQKGSGAIKRIDVKEHGDVAIRDMLWRNDGASAENESKLERLNTARAELTVRLSKLRTLEEERGDALIKVRLSNREQRCRVTDEIRRVEKELGYTAKQIEATRAEIKNAAADCAPAVLAWQERAVQLMVIHKLLDTRAGDNTASPGGSRMPTRELQQQLAAEGFQVDDRQLRRFKRKCGAEGQQGKRTDRV